MSKRVGKVRVNLDSKDLIEISMKDIKAIIRGADELRVMILLPGSIFTA